MSYDTWKSTDPRDTEPDFDGEREHDRLRDEAYAAEFATLVACFRVQIDGEPRTPQAFAKQLRGLSSRMLDTISADGLGVQQAFADFGPQAVLRALATAYEQPQHVMSDVVEHP